jgi:hypothetical protein
MEFVLVMVTDASNLGVVCFSDEGFKPILHMHYKRHAEGLWEMKRTLHCTPSTFSAFGSRVF